jgi:hypothetical protein
MKTGADWLAWLLQFAAGLVAGLLLGLVILGSRSGMRSIWLGKDLIPAFLTGWALVGAGLASWHGDRLWLGRSFRVVRPDGVTHSRTSRIASLTAAAAGGLLVARVMLLHLA